jgi:hypothetical protein
VTIDLSEAKIHFPAGTYYPPTSFQEVTERGHFRPMTAHTITLNDGEKKVYLSFNAPYDQTKTFVVELGNVVVGNSQVTLPPLKYSRQTKYRYLPFVFSH